MSEVKLPEELKIKIKQAVKDKAKELAKFARDEIRNEYLSVIYDFYNEYQPEYYYRHMEVWQMKTPSLVKNSGMGRTFKTMKVNKGTTLFQGGIYISTENMYDDYKGTQDQVLYSFLSGYHGLPLNDPYAIYGSIRVYDHMIKYRDYIEDTVRENFKVELNFL